ncbi:MAG: hypothetical protein HYY00_09585 [Chloroflexi bacterium]|nr:hypothetical protein [Chloroflexota bacterium]
MNPYRVAQVFLLTRAIERSLRELVLSRLPDVKPDWWDSVPQKVKDNAERCQASSPVKGLHLLHFVSLTELLHVVELFFKELFGTSPPVDLKALWAAKDARNGCYHSRDLSAEEEEKVKLAARQLLIAIKGEDPELAEALKFQTGLAEGGDNFVFVPAFDSQAPAPDFNRPLFHYYGFADGLLKPLGLGTRTVTKADLSSEREFRRLLSECKLIWIPSAILALAFTEVDWFDLFVREILNGKPALIQTQGPRWTESRGPIWAAFLDKLGLSSDQSLRLFDETDYDCLHDIIVFRKENECLRDAALFDGVDEITVDTPFHLSGRALARRVVFGGPSTRVLDWTQDEWTRIQGAHTGCMSVATHSVVPGTSLRVLALSGHMLEDPGEDVGERPHFGLSKNVPFAYNALEWLLRQGQI